MESFIKDQYLIKTSHMNIEKLKSKIFRSRWSFYEEEFSFVYHYPYNGLDVAVFLIMKQHQHSDERYSHP